MAENEQRETSAEVPGDQSAEGRSGSQPSEGASAAPGDTPAEAPAETSAEPGAEAPPAEAADRPGLAVWEAFDAVLQAFGQERGVGVGTFWGESAAEIDGRFAAWANASGWRCTLQLVRAPEENVVVLVAQGPPLPGGRARMIVLGAFPPEFERDTLRAALEVGYGIGETWGPAEEPPEPPPAAAPDATQAPAS